MPDTIVETAILKTENLTKKTELRIKRRGKTDPYHGASCYAEGNMDGENKKDKYVVSHVSLTLNRGDIYGMIGAGGSGRTMLFRLICGLTKPTEGSVSLFGATGERQMQKARRKVGAMVGDPVFYGDLTALENLIVQSRYFPNPVSRKEMWELLEQVGLKDVGQRRAGGFDAGMRRLLGVALALVGKPELVILDEPYLKVEDEKAELLRRFLMRLNRERELTILFGSAAAERFSGLANRYGFLHEGRLARELCEENSDSPCNEQGQAKETSHQGEKSDAICNEAAVCNEAAAGMEET